MQAIVLTVLKFIFGADLAASKKFRSAIVGVIATLLTPLLAGKLGMDPVMVEKLTDWVAGIVITLVGSQGLADFGKEGKKPELPLPPPPAEADGVPGQPSIVP